MRAVPGARQLAKLDAQRVKKQLRRRPLPYPDGGEHEHRVESSAVIAIIICRRQWRRGLARRKKPARNRATRAAGGLRRAEQSASFIDGSSAQSSGAQRTADRRDDEEHGADSRDGRSRWSAWRGGRARVRKRSERVANRRLKRDDRRLLGKYRPVPPSRRPARRGSC